MFKVAGKHLARQLESVTVWHNTLLRTDIHVPIPLTEQSFKVLSMLTAIKLATIGIAIGQIMFLGAL
jgi:hypothetical protein